MRPLPIGASGEMTITVTAEMVVPALKVYSTPSMVGHMEGVCAQIMAPYYEIGETSVGYRVDIRHMAPTSVGMKVVLKGRVTEMDGRRVVFAVEAYNESGAKIGEGIHERRVIDPRRFRERANA